MSEFITIAPSDWTLFELDSLRALTGVQQSELKNMEASGYFGDLTEKMRLAGLITEDNTVLGVKLVNEDRELYIKIN